MANCEYMYLETFELYGSKIRDILINDSSKPYPIYENLNNYNNDSSEFKGLLVWETSKYYKGVLFENLSNNVPEIHFFTVPEFGETIYKFPAFNQMFIISFDYLPHRDKFGKKTIETINWFINKHKELIEDINLSMSNGQNLIVKLESISKPLPQQSSYIRRSIIYKLMYCNC